MRDAMPAAERAAASVAICDAANAVLASQLSSPATVALYAAKGSEVDAARIDAFARASGWAVAYPRVVAGTRALAFAVAGLDELVASGLGLREPPAESAAVAVADIAAFIVPGLAFDRAGGRIGWGRGHYDATFAVAPAALRIGLAFARQIVERVAREPHDVALDFIITEDAIHRVA